MSDDAAVFGAWLRACRYAAGLSQGALAERSGLSIRAISDLERGRTRWPHPDSVRRLADALELRGPARAEFFRTLAAGAADVTRLQASPARRGAGADLPLQADEGADGLLQASPDGEQGRAGHARAVVPRQLPGPVRLFVGRDAELAALTGLLDSAGSTPAAVMISAIGGTAGVGKTALALHWAHQVAGRFPDGQLYVNLRGFHPSGKPMSSAGAIRDLLDAFQVPAEQIPASLDAQAGLYRSLLAGRRMLVVLDNARDAGQVRPLLPGSPGCLVVVTSRSQLAGLAATDGAYQLTLDLLTEAEARQLLVRRLGAARLAQEPEAVAELIALCARLPLALAITAARASSRPGFGLGALAEELADARRRLDALDAGDAAASVRAVFSWSLDSLSAPAARLFALLGLHPGPDVTIEAAASLADISLPQARRVILELADAHLITEHVPGRFSLHDLLHAYTAERAAADSDQGRQAALARVLDHYLHTARTAALLLNPARVPVTPSRVPVPLSPPQPGVTPEHLDGQQHALAWLEAERHVLIAVITLAARAGFDTCAWQLPWAMSNFLDRRGYWQDSATVHSTALHATTRLGDTAAQTAIRRQLAHACIRLADYDQAGAHLTHCLKLYQQAGDRAGEAHVQVDLSLLSGQQGRHADALSHAEQALALYQATGNRAAQAAALNNLGYSHAQLGSYGQARAFCRQALTLYRKLGNPSGEANSWDSLGYAEYQLGNLAPAADCYRHALSIFGELGEPYYQAGALTHLGDTCHAAGEQDKAREAWQQALAILDDLDHPDAGYVRGKLTHPIANPTQHSQSGS